MRTTTRFAPSPTGHLHLGHAHAALAARAAGERFLLRIEDIDATRCRPDYTDAILEDLAWLGIAWDGPVRIQSRHLAEYQAALDRLHADGLLYPCFCTRADIRRHLTAPHGPDGPLYPGTCRHLSADERAARIAAGAPHAWRLDMARAFMPGLTYREMNQGVIRCDPARFGDVVLARKDVPASYHLCVTHDDALQGVTLVTRGIDLQPATDLHRLLQTLLGYPEPAYAHHRLLTDAAGRRLAKRDHAATLRGLREAGYSPGEIRKMAGFHG
jgi:glutamyl-Q tRNA(Asp) synthetase